VLLRSRHSKDKYDQDSSQLNPMLSTRQYLIALPGLTLSSSSAYSSSAH